MAEDLCHGTFGTMVNLAMAITVHFTLIKGVRDALKIRGKDCTI